MKVKKICAGVMTALVLGTYSVPVWAADTTDVVVKTVTRTEKKVDVECPEVVGGNKKATGKINNALSRQVASLVSEASTLGGGSVHYDVHKADEDLISLTLVMTPNMGMEETQGMTFNRKTGDLKPLSDYYSGNVLAQRAKEGLSYLYDVPEEKQDVLPDTYYVDTDGSVIGLYHAGAVLDKNEGEIEINLSASGLDDGVVAGPTAENQNTAEPVEVKIPTAPKKEKAEPKVEPEKKQIESVKETADRKKKTAEKIETPEKETASAKRKTATASESKPAEISSTANAPHQTMKERIAALQAEKAAREQAEGEARLQQLEANQIAQTKKREAEEAARRAEAERQAELARQQAAAQQAAIQETNRSTGTTAGTITGTEVRMRAAAGLDGEVTGTFTQGERVTVLYGRNASGMKWYEVQRADGTKGWVAGEYCQVVETALVPSVNRINDRQGKITGSEVRMRSDPSHNADVLDYFEKGEIVTILDAAEGTGIQWTKVQRQNGDVGWVASIYCQEI